MGPAVGCKWSSHQWPSSMGFTNQLKWVSTELQYSLSFWPKTQWHGSVKSLTFMHDFLQTFQICGCFSTLWGFGASVWLTGKMSFSFGRWTHPKKWLFQWIFLLHRYMIEVLIVNCKSKIQAKKGRQGPEGEYKYSSTFSLTLTLDGRGWSTLGHGRCTPGNVSGPLYRRLGGPQSRSGRMRKISPAGIRSQDRPARSKSLYRLSYRGPP